MDERLLTTTCTIVTTSEGTADVYGDATPSETQTSTVCHYEQVKSSEVEGAAVEETQWRVWLPASAAGVSGADRLIIDSESYTLTGDADPLIRPTTGLVDHVECIVKRTR